MHYPIPPDVQDLIAAQLATGRYQNEDEVLREALHALQQASDEAAAVQKAGAGRQSPRPALRVTSHQR